MGKHILEKKKNWRHTITIVKKILLMLANWYFAEEEEELIHLCICCLLSLWMTCEIRIMVMNWLAGYSKYFQDSANFFFIFIFLYFFIFIVLYFYIFIFLYFKFLYFYIFIFLYFYIFIFLYFYVFIYGLYLF